MFGNRRLPHCMALAAVAVLVRIATVGGAEQTGETFEVASIKASAPAGAANGGFAQMIVQAGRFRASNATLRDLVRRAYEVMDFQIVGDPPPWFDREHFDITATTGGQKDRSRVLGMVRLLLADRFKLRAYAEIMQLPIYELRMARTDGKVGPQLRRTSAECEQARAESATAPRPLEPGAPRCASSVSSIGVIKAEGYAMPDLAKTLTPMVGRPVHDQTGLEGRYDWQVDFDPEAIARMNAAMGAPQLPAGNSGPPLDRPLIGVAIREQLGLKLEPAIGPVAVVVIEHAERPTPD